MSAMPESRKVLPAGSNVFLRLDNGDEYATVTRSEPWQLAGGQWVVLIAGRTGGWALERVTPFEEVGC